MEEINKCKYLEIWRDGRSNMRESALKGRSVIGTLKNLVKWDKVSMVVKKKKKYHANLDVE